MVCLPLQSISSQKGFHWISSSPQPCKVRRPTCTLHTLLHPTASSSAFQIYHVLLRKRAVATAIAFILSPSLLQNYGCVFLSYITVQSELRTASLHLRSKQIVLSRMEGREVQCVPLSLSGTAVPCWHSQHSCSQLFWPVWVMPPLQLGRGLLMPGGTYYREKVAVGTGHTWQSTPGFLFPFPLKL